MAIMAMFFTGIGLGIVFSMSILQFGLTGGAVAVVLLSALSDLSAVMGFSVSDGLQESMESWRNHGFSTRK